MNSLNLRVSSVKTGEHVKKNSEIRRSPMSIPDKYSTRNDDYVLLFKNASTIPDQVMVVKRVHEKCNNTNGSLQFLADLYFTGPLKHPVRNQIAKLLQQSSNRNEVIDALSEALKNLLKELPSDNAIACNQLNRVVSSISGCFENFPPALEAFKRYLQFVMEFLLKWLRIYTIKIRENISPSIKNEFYLLIHNSIRLILSSIQEFSELHLNEKLLKSEELIKMSKGIILDSDVPMDIKTNCGILIAYIKRLSNKYDIFTERVAANILDSNNCFELCLCCGVINTLHIYDFSYSSEIVERIVKKIVLISNKHSTEPNMLLCGSRALFQVSKILLNCAVGDIDYMEIVFDLFDYILSYIEHHMDSVRHICKDMLRNVIKFCEKHEAEDILQHIFKVFKSSSISLSIKCILISNTASTLGSSRILREYPNIFIEIFSKNFGKDLNVDSCYESLMLNCDKESSYDTWKQTWIAFLLKEINNNNIHAVENLLTKAIKYNPKIVEFIIIDNEDKISLRTCLLALWTIRKNGLNLDNFDHILTQFSRNLQKSIISSCDDTKIMALRLLVEKHKTTETLKENECELILLFLKYNSNCQSPSTREKCLALLMKALTRFEINLKKYLKQPKTDQDFYMNFLRDVTKLLIGNLFPGANFSRRTISLNLLEVCLDIIINNGLNVKEFLSEDDCLSLFNTLKDSYEVNKGLGLNILKKIDNTKAYNIHKHVTLDEIKNLMTSIRPTDSATAAYYLEFYCHSISQDEAQQQFRKELSQHHQAVYYLAISWCIDILEDGLITGQKSILLAAKQNPFYGVLFTIKHLITKLDFIQLSNDNQWRELIEKLINLCKNLTETVAPIVNSSSPEGHLPNDFSEIPEYLGEDSEDINAPKCKVLSPKQNLNINNLKTTPQMVLICAWRTVKEVSLILGEIVLKSPIQSTTTTKVTTSNYLITCNQILEIGSHFKKLLSETKHRGAFEQAYVGFLKLCTRLWRVEYSSLHELPLLWLNELITIISQDDKINEKICATRRSAGVPFMVQALITSELQVGTTKSLNYCMKHLIELCKNNNDNKSTESRTHALNILRALFRCTDLNEAICEYISDGVKCSISGYSSNTWAEKNSSTLLFSTLITRIFGVQRTKDTENLNIRNKLTGRIFFLRYPQLYDFFLNELKEASEAIFKEGKASKLHPLLLILSRLYPSALEGTESNLRLSEFIPFISICSGSSEMQTRHLAAKAVVAFTSQDLLSDHVFMILHFLKSENYLNSNYQHGLLLQILYLIRSQKNFNDEFLCSMMIKLIQIMERLHLNPVVFKTVFDILIEAIQRLPQKKLTEPIETHLKNLMSNSNIFTAEFSYSYPVFMKSLCLFKLYLTKIFLPEEDLTKNIGTALTTGSNTYEETETCLNIILLIIFTGHQQPDFFEEFECSKEENSFVEQLLDLKKLQIEMKNSDELLLHLNTITKNRLFYPECTMKAYVILSQLKGAKFNLSSLILEAQTLPGDVKISLTMCIEKCMNDIDLSKEQRLMCMDFIFDICQPWNPFSLRLQASNILHHIEKYFKNTINENDTEFIIKFSNVVITLLMDDDYDVRTNVSNLVVNMSNEQLFEDQLTPTYAQKIFFQHLAILINSLGDEAILEILQGIIKFQIESNEAEGTSNDIEFEVFDKNEANIFAEPRKAVMDCIEVFLEYFKARTKLCGFVRATSELCN